MADLLTQANAVLSNMEKTYGRKTALRMAYNVFLNTYGCLANKESSCDGTLFDQYLDKIVRTFSHCEDMVGERKKSSN